MRSMKKRRLHLYTLDVKYVRDLANADNRVMSVSPQQHKENRPFVGIIIIMKQHNYCIPMTSPKPKHNKMKNDLDFSKILDSNNCLIGALNFNNMIPVSNDVIQKLDIRPSSSDTPKEREYKELLNNQLDWCNDNIDNIIKKANKLYRLITQSPEKSINLTRRCCDFKKLEAVLDEIIRVENITVSDEEMDEQYELISQKYGQPVDVVKQVLPKAQLKPDLLRMKASQLIIDAAEIIMEESGK